VVNRLAAVYLEDGNLGKADRLELPQWLERLRVQPAASDGLVPLLQDLATLESLRSRFERARSLFQEALDRSEQGSIVDATTRNDFGLACLRAREYGAAVELLTASSTLWEKLRGPDSVAAGTTAYNLALAYEASGRFPEAETRIEVALRIAEKRIGPDSLRTAEVLAANARLLRKLHRNPEARRILARAERIMREQEPRAGSYTIDVSELSLRSREKAGYERTSRLH
jgi:tetratricopeptide (TPR) repeat protein